MKVLIVEDEKPAADNLIACINSVDLNIEIAGITTHVNETIEWLQHNPSPNIILCDIELADGLSFNIFKTQPVNCPIIFITAYNKYLAQAFEYNAIDYLLKPVDSIRLANTLRKYKNLEQHFVANNYASLIDYLNDTHKNRTRIIVKKGTEFQTVSVDNAAYFFSEHKLVFVVDKDNKKYLCDTTTLSDMEKMLNTKKFFRANRKYILNADYITKFKSVDKSKLSVELSVHQPEEIIVSQENASVFKKWISEL